MSFNRTAEMRHHYEHYLKQTIKTSSLSSPEIFFGLQAGELTRRVPEVSN